MVGSRLEDFRAARHHRLFQDVVSQVMELIATGELSPGSRLPPERQLTKQIQVSRNVLREAFRVLEERGIIVARPGDGRYVRALNSARHRSPADPVDRLEVATIFDLLETREVIETKTVAFACARITASEVPRLRDAAARIESWQDNAQFHVTLASATHNYMLERLVREQLELLHDLHQREHYLGRDLSRKLLREHKQIAEAVIARDVQLAQSLMRRHFAHTRQGLTDLHEAARGKGRTDDYLPSR